MGSFFTAFIVLNCCFDGQYVRIKFQMVYQFFKTGAISDQVFLLNQHGIIQLYDQTMISVS